MGEGGFCIIVRKSPSCTTTRHNSYALRTTVVGFCFVLFYFLSLPRKVLLFSGIFKSHNQEEEGGARKLKVKWNRECQRLSRKSGRKRCDDRWVMRKTRKRKTWKDGCFVLELSLVFFNRPKQKMGLIALNYFCPVELYIF